MRMNSKHHPALPNQICIVPAQNKRDDDVEGKDLSENAYSQFLLLIDK